MHLTQWRIQDFRSGGRGPHRGVHGLPRQLHFIKVVCQKERIGSLSKLDHKEELETIAIMEQSMLDIKSLMDQVRLKMNESKTEFIYFG